MVGQTGSSIQQVMIHDLCAFACTMGLSGWVIDITVSQTDCCSMETKIYGYRTGRSNISGLCTHHPLKPIVAVRKKKDLEPFLLQYSDGICIMIWQIIYSLVAYIQIHAHTYMYYIFNLKHQIHNEQMDIFCYQDMMNDHHCYELNGDFHDQICKFSLWM